MVGIDGSEQSINAADYAIDIAKRHNAELIAVNVLTSDIGYAYSSPGVESPPLTKGNHFAGRRRSEKMA